jgi:hypothetical protein
MVLEWIKKTIPDYLTVPITLTGKNAASFDLRFLRRLDGWRRLPFSHRLIDPGSLYLRPTDNGVPNTEECLKRAGIDKEVSHDALDDAYDVCKLIRVWENQYEEFHR